MIKLLESDNLQDLIDLRKQFIKLKFIMYYNYAILQQAIDKKQIYGIFEDGILVAYIWFVNLKRKPFCRIEELAVKPDSEINIGACLLKIVEENCIHSKIVTHVTDFNINSINFHKNAGYEFYEYKQIGKIRNMVFHKILDRKRLIKCIVLDLDNTLWGGVIGDDGINGIKLTNDYIEFQKYLVDIKQKGILLTVCSKNELSIAQEPFLKHPDMILKLSDIILFVANWEDKACNIRSIQNRLNIGMDSILFIDDNPAEREFVSINLPSICVPSVNSSPFSFIKVCKDIINIDLITDEDKRRDEFYTANIEREKYKSNFDDNSVYLNELNMNATIMSITKNNIERISQLTQRTNQFNTRTIRYSVSDIERISNSPEYICRAFSLKDKFGDNGLIGVIILHHIENYLFIENWVMSCRVFNRGMELFIFNYVVELALQLGIKKIQSEFIPTSKNKVIKDLYYDLGFIFNYLDLNNFKPFCHFINCEKNENKYIESN